MQLARVGKNKRFVKNHSGYCHMHLDEIYLRQLIAPSHVGSMNSAKSFLCKYPNILDKSRLFSRNHNNDTLVYSLCIMPWIFSSFTALKVLTHSQELVTFQKMSITLTRQLYHIPKSALKSSTSLINQCSGIYVLSSSSYQTHFHPAPSTSYDPSAPETILLQKPAHITPPLLDLPGLEDPLPAPEEFYVVPNIPAHSPPGYTPTRLLVIDILSILFRAHHALIYNRDPLVRPVDGRTVSALHGFCTALKRILVDVKPTHIIAAMDTPSVHGKRRAMDPVSPSRITSIPSRS